MEQENERDQDAWCERHKEYRKRKLRKKLGSTLHTYPAGRTKVITLYEYLNMYITVLVTTISMKSAKILSIDEWIKKRLYL